MPAETFAGTTYLHVDGNIVPLKSSITISGFTTMKEEIIGLDGGHGFKEVPRAPFISVTVSRINRGSLSFSYLQGLENISVTAESQTNTAYVLTGATVTGTPELNTETGELTIIFTGTDLVESVGSGA